MKRFLTWAICLALAVTFTGCSTASDHRKAVRAEDADRLTAGRVQREIRVGMTDAEVAEALGAPNVIATDENRREVWVYDRIATEQAYSASSGGVAALILAGFTGSVAAGGGILPITEDHRVRDFAYRQSSF